MCRASTWNALTPDIRPARLLRITPHHLGQHPGVCTDPAEITHHVHVNVASVDRLHRALVQSADVRQLQLVFPVGDLVMLSYYLGRQLRVTRCQRRDRTFEQMFDPPVKTLDLPPARSLSQSSP